MTTDDNPRQREFSSIEIATEYANALAADLPASFVALPTSHTDLQTGRTVYQAYATADFAGHRILIWELEFRPARRAYMAQAERYPVHDDDVAELIARAESWYPTGAFDRLHEKMIAHYAAQESEINDAFLRARARTRETIDRLIEQEN